MNDRGKLGKLIDESASINAYKRGGKARHDGSMC